MSLLRIPWSSLRIFQAKNILKEKDVYGVVLGRNMDNLSEAIAAFTKQQVNSGFRDDV